MDFRSIKALQDYCRYTFNCTVTAEFAKRYLAKRKAKIRSYEWNDEWELPEFAQAADQEYAASQIEE